MSDAYDADVLITAVNPGPTSAVCRAAIAGSNDRIGSVVLVPEVMTKPVRLRDDRELGALTDLLATFDLKVVDEEVADASVTLGAKYRLKTPDAIHLATAVVWGAERFYTNNSKDFGPHITEVEIVIPGAA